ncbi:HAD family hydrolase [uncultured Nocardioides sp.]|uniref:HAD family hydrolase n=1 Tax=uncultured Nocardioides sp. TaxID=198441 RepID=UPI00260DE105|nr:HAD family hydrolase [uncultured Nocardioides sp.]
MSQHTVNHGHPSDGWQPKLVALDIDGTLLRWNDTDEGPGASVEEVTPAVRDAVRRVVDAGVEVVLASGRSPYDMTRIADLLELHVAGAQPLWVVAANGAVVFRYPPVDVVHEETFDARESVVAALERHPEAIVAVEERGVGYRMNRPFPPGELTGEHTIVDVAELVSEPVTRVIIRDPQASVDDFVDLAENLGLAGTQYVVGWTAWLDLMPVGVDKSSGLSHVCEALGVDPTDVLAIGDGRNDVEMLSWAGRGVAMGQAVDVVHDAADATTGTVDDDGAAQEITRWF